MQAIPVHYPRASRLLLNLSSFQPQLHIHRLLLMDIIAQYPLRRDTISILPTF
jgi:hypothetical protein